MSTVLRNKPAETWDSYRDSLTLALDYFRPRRCFEWGVGTSTLLISGMGYVESLDSVEHSPEWIDRIKPWPEKANVILEQKDYLYPLVTGRFDEYDFIFIDGKLREQCLDRAHSMLSRYGFVCLHDAEREQYEEFICKYAYNIFTDEGHTCFLTNQEDVAKGLKECLS